MQKTGLPSVPNTPRTSCGVSAGCCSRPTPSQLCRSRRDRSDLLVLLVASRSIGSFLLPILGEHNPRAQKHAEGKAHVRIETRTIANSTPGNAFDSSFLYEQQVAAPVAFAPRVESKRADMPLGSGNHHAMACWVRGHPSRAARPIGGTSGPWTCTENPECL